MSKITFFPVGNGDMTLIRLNDAAQTSILIDCNIREAADDPKQTDTRDVAKDLRERLKKDSNGRPYVDAFLLSHPDQDHCRGIQKHFYLGAPKDYPDDKKKAEDRRIFVREIWSSPMVFRRASKSHTLCEDAAAFNSEAKRRVQVNRNKNFLGILEGDRIQILGEDEGGKTDDLGTILIKIDTVFNKINAQSSNAVEMRLLAPLPKGDDDTEELLSKNHSSVILNFKFAADGASDVYRFLTGGDAEVAIWERLWLKHRGSPDVLKYNMLLCPHHCSWHSLSYDSWSEKGEGATVNQDARAALSQIRVGGFVVSSSQKILDDDNDPPCIRAKREYEGIAKGAKGKFFCTDEHPSKATPAPMEFQISKTGASILESKEAQSLLRPAAAAGLTFPDKPLGPNKPGGFA